MPRTASSPPSWKNLLTTTVKCALTYATSCSASGDLQPSLQSVLVPAIELVSGTTSVGSDEKTHPEGVKMAFGSTVASRSNVPQRRYLTILFCDLVGYTELSEQLDPEDLRDLQLQYQRLALTVMERYGGFVAQFSGDGVLVYFGYPSAHENDAERAVRAALELSDRLEELNVDLRGQQLPEIAVRMGIHTGLIVIGSELAS